jgi:hypothetical protein
MQRDMDLIREILLKLEAHPHGFAPALEIDGYTDEQIGFHVSIMGQARLLDVHEVTTHGAGSPRAIPSAMRWEAYEFLAAIKDESTWKKSKATLMSKTGTLGFELLKAVLTAEIRRQLGLP